MSMSDEEVGRFRDVDTSCAYVAFIDVLGFSQYIESDFDGAVETYEGLIKFMELCGHVTSSDDFLSSVSIRLYSDALLVTCVELLPLVKSVNLLNMATLGSNCLVRGGIGYGRHVEQESGTNVFVVSQALSRAVAKEKQVSRPCVALDSSVVVPDEYWQSEAPNVLRPLLFYDGIVVVNPFNIGWGLSARTRVEMMIEQFPEHRAKYDWFIELGEAVFSDELLIPGSFVSEDTEGQGDDPP